MSQKEEKERDVWGEKERKERVVLGKTNGFTLYRSRRKELGSEALYLLK